MKADLCIFSGECEKVLDIGKKLGLDMAGLIVPLEEIAALRKLMKSRDWREKPRLAVGTEVCAARAGQLRPAVCRVRKSADIIVVRGGTEELNRAAVETPEADILLDHSVGGRSGINHVLAKLARKNNVSIGFDFNQVVTSYRMGRIQDFSAMVETARTVRKYSTPFVLTSGARDPWGMRSPSELLGLGSQLGFTAGESGKGLSDEIVRENRKRLSGKWVMPGVEIE